MRRIKKLQRRQGYFIASFFKLLTEQGCLYALQKAINVLLLSYYYQFKAD